MTKRWLLTLATTLLIAVTTAPCKADLSLGDAANYAVLFTGTGGNSLQINNGPGPHGLAVTGNIGIGNNGKLGASGPLVIKGNVDFAGSPNPSTNPSGGNISITGTYTGSHSNVTTDLSNLSTLSSMLGAESGKSLTVNLNNGQSQTIDASTGILDGSGDRVFTVSSFAFNNAATLTIDGKNLGQNVVLNFAGNAQFGGTILLTGGLDSDSVLFNITGTNHTLQINTNGATESGIFLDPNGTMSINHSVLNGRFFGGDSHNMSIVSGGEVIAPGIIQTQAVSPEPSTLLVAGAGALGIIGYGLRRRRTG
jgi:hypothetical protein